MVLSTARLCHPAGGRTNLFFLFNYLLRTSSAVIDKLGAPYHVRPCSTQIRTPYDSSSQTLPHASLLVVIPLRGVCVYLAALAGNDPAASLCVRSFVPGDNTPASVAASTSSQRGVQSYVPLLPEPNVHIRAARREDIPAIESCNLKTLPENYPNSFYHNHLLQWPYLALVAEKIPVSVANLDDEKKIVGYVLGRVETPQGLYDPASVGSASRKTGHVSSLAVLDGYRRHGIARKLMEILHVQMRFRYGVDSSTLHVRCSNRAAQKLYLQNLGYRVVETVNKYYQDGADAYYMELSFQRDTAEGTTTLSATPSNGVTGGTPTTVREKDTPLLTEDSEGYFHHPQAVSQPSPSVA